LCVFGTEGVVLWLCLLLKEHADMAGQERIAEQTIEGPELCLNKPKQPLFICAELM
jgi:hypothetical protein